LPFLDADDTLIEVLHSKLRDRVKAFTASDKETLDEHFPVVDPNTLESLADKISAVALEIRTVAEKFLDQNP
jgi:hypothetical protein